MKEYLFPAAIIAGIGYLWYNRSNLHKTQIYNSFLSLLSSDEAQNSIPISNRVPLSQTASNLTAMYFRKNITELRFQADELMKKGYKLTSAMITNYSNTLI